MIPWRKIRTIALFEFFSTVKRKSYLIATFGMPLFILGYAGIISGIHYVMESGESEPRIYGIVDRAGILALREDLPVPQIEIPEEIRETLQSTGQLDLVQEGLSLVGSAIFRPLETREQAKQAIVNRQIRGYFILPVDYLQSGLVLEYLVDHPGLETSSPRRSLRTLIQRRLVSGRVNPEIGNRITNPLAEVKSWTVDENGRIEELPATAEVAKLIVPLAFTFLLFTALMMSAGYLVQGTAVEKENKVVEILLSSARPQDVLAGKLVGLGAAGLLQVLVWFGMIIAGALILAATLAALGVKIPWAAMAIGVVFFAVGYLLLGSLMLGFGSLGSTQRESQQLGAIWSLLAVVPMMFLGILLQEPHGLVGQVMTWIPFTAPVTVIFRFTMDPSGIRWWEIAGSLLLMMASVRVAIGVGARLFRIGLVLTGTRPRLREILRQARLE